VFISGEGRRNKRVFPGQLSAAQRFQPAGHGGVRQGWKKTGFFKKKTAQWVFLGFFGFFLYICPEEGVFRVFQFQEFFKVHPDFKL
jgi:hypothetical protein